MDANKTQPITDADPSADPEHLEFVSLKYANRRTTGELTDGVMARVAIDGPGTQRQLRVVGLVLELDVNVMLLEAVHNDRNTANNHMTTYAAARANFSDDDGVWMMAPLQLSYDEPEEALASDEDASRALRFQLVVKAARWALNKARA